MKNKSIILLVGILIAGCQNTNVPENDQVLLKRYKEQAMDLDQKINKLENKLNNDTSLVNNSQAINVKTKILKPENFNHYIIVNGNVQAEKEALISPEIGGKVEKILVIEGQSVKKNQLLVLINTEVIQSNIREIKVSLDLATATYKKQKELWSKNIGSEMQYLQAKNQKQSLESRLKTLNAQLDMAHIRAPFSGIIDEINIKPGEQATPGIQILHLINLSRLKIYGNVSETYLSSIHTGDLVELSFPTFPDYTRKGVIFRTGKVINAKNRTFSIELKLDNSDQKILPNLICRIKISDYRNKAALLVPSPALKKDFNGWFLYKTTVRDDKKFATKVYVEPGISFENNTEVLKGLAPGDEIITVGFNQVAGGRLIKVVS